MTTRNKKERKVQKSNERNMLSVFHRSVHVCVFVKGWLLTLAPVCSFAELSNGAAMNMLVIALETGTKYDGSAEDERIKR